MTKDMDGVQARVPAPRLYVVCVDESAVLSDDVEVIGDLNELAVLDFARSVAETLLAIEGLKRQWSAADEGRSEL